VSEASLLRRIDAMEQMLHDMRREILSAHAQDSDVVQVPRQGPWYRAMLVELYPHVVNMPGALALLDETAERAPTYVTYQQVRSRSGLSDREQRNEHAALTRLSVAVFGHRTWPVAWQQAANGEMRYWMPAQLAGWWRELRHHHEGARHESIAS
jgi:hypothetical protein